MIFRETASYFGRQNRQSVSCCFSRRRSVQGFAIVNLPSTLFRISQALESTRSLWIGSFRTGLVGIYHGGCIFTNIRTYDRTYFSITPFTTRLFDSAVVRDCQQSNFSHLEDPLFFRLNVDRLRLFVRHPFSNLINTKADNPRC